MILLSGLMLIAAPGAGQSATQVNDWSLSAVGGGRCAIGATMGPTVLLFSRTAAGAERVSLVNPGWTLEPAKTYKLSLGWSDGTPDTVIQMKVGKSPKGLFLSASAPPGISEAFRKSDMLTATVFDLDLVESANITDGAKIWAALETCANNAGQ